MDEETISPVWMERELDGKVAIITGGARGFGMAMAHGYLRAGAMVALVDRDAEGIAEAVAELNADGLKPLPSVVDIRFDEQIDRCVQTVLDKFGRIDVLINNAAVLMRFIKGNADERPPFWEIKTEHWKELWDINMTGTWLFSRRVALEMIKNRRGSIINIMTAPHVLRSGKHIPYGTSKAGIEAFTMAAAEQLLPYGVRMNALHPGDDKALAPKRSNSTRKGRPVIVPAAVFLGSDKSAQITGRSISALQFNRDQGLSDL